MNTIACSFEGCKEDAVFIVLDKDNIPLGAGCTMRHLVPTMVQTRELQGRVITTLLDYKLRKEAK